MPPRRLALVTCTAAVLLVLSAAGAKALGPRSAVSETAGQETQGGSAIAGFGALDPSQPIGVTPEEIVKRFGDREAAFAQARENYAFRQTVRVDTISDDTGKPDGEYQQVTDITFDKAGHRDEHVVFAPQNTLERVSMSPADFQDIEHRLPFVLTTADLPQYDIQYLGKQKVDDLDTYVFEAGPKVIEKNRRYYKGKVWVDQQDLQIVLVSGKNVPDDVRRGHEDLSPPFSTYYEQIDGKYWFPTYTKAEGELHFPSGPYTAAQNVRLRTVVKYTDYKQFRATSRIIYNGEDITDNNKDNAQPKDETRPTGQPKSTEPPKPTGPPNR